MKVRSYCAIRAIAAHDAGPVPTENFNSVLRAARGEFFIWLADDDWIDSNYVTSCLPHLLVAGAAGYYKGDKEVPYGKLFEVRASAWWRRILAYYLRVSDNGAFYGVMRREAAQRALGKADGLWTCPESACVANLRGERRLGLHRFSREDGELKAV